MDRERICGSGGDCEQDKRDVLRRQLQSVRRLADRRMARDFAYQKSSGRGQVRGVAASQSKQPVRTPCNAGRGLDK